MTQDQQFHVVNSKKVEVLKRWDSEIAETMGPGGRQKDLTGQLCCFLSV